MERRGSQLSYSAEMELRALLEDRENQKELDRKKTSRTFTKILLATVILLAGAILCFPDNRKVLRKVTAPAAPVDIESAPVMPQVFAPPAEDAQIAKELKPFAVKEGKNSQKDDIRFASELLQFLQPQSAPPSQAGPPRVEKPSTAH